MGVAIPVITASGEPPKLLYSPGDTAAVLDEASTAFREVLLRIPQLSCLLLPSGGWRTNCAKLNAVSMHSSIFLSPNIRILIAFIVSSLEERERGNLPLEMAQDEADQANCENSPLRTWSRRIW